MSDRPVSPRLVTLAAFYFLVALTFAGELLWPGRSLYRWDTLLYTWPMIQEARAQLLAGHWPFWTSAFCGGTPLLENINAGVFYPLKILVYALPLRAGYQLFLFVHVWAAHPEYRFDLFHRVLVRDDRMLERDDDALRWQADFLRFGAAGELPLVVVHREQLDRTHKVDSGY